MALLKEDGSLDIERINKLPIEEYMEEVSNFTNEQREEYYSKSPINESTEPVRSVTVDYTLEEDIEKNGMQTTDHTGSVKTAILGHF